MFPTHNPPPPNTSEISARDKTELVRRGSLFFLPLCVCAFSFLKEKREKGAGGNPNTTLKTRKSPEAQRGWQIGPRGSKTQMSPLSVHLKL